MRGERIGKSAAGHLCRECQTTAPHGDGMDITVYRCTVTLDRRIEDAQVRRWQHLGAVEVKQFSDHTEVTLYRVACDIFGAVASVPLAHFFATSHTPANAVKVTIEPAERMTD